MGECCEGCKFCKFIKGQERGVMDCDPDEWVCRINKEDFIDYEDEEDSKGYCKYKEEIE